MIRFFQGNELRSPRAKMKTVRQERTSVADDAVSRGKGRARRGKTPVEDLTLLRKLVAAIPDIVLQTDMDGNIVYANEVALRYSGLSSMEELIGQNAFSFVAPENRDEARERLALILEGQRGPTESRMTFHPDQKFCFEINGGLLRDEQGTPYGTVFLIRDCTERKRLEDDLQKRLAELQEASVHISTLQGILPICSYCHRIRNDQECWEQLEKYISEHSDAQFSHSLCPECLQKHFPEAVPLKK